MSRIPLKPSLLRSLADHGIRFGAVIDVGVQSCTRELMVAFPDLHHYLFEPISEWAPKIETAYGKAGVDYTLSLVALSDQTGTATLELDNLMGGENITHANIVDTPDTKMPLREVPCTSLDRLQADGFFENAPYLLKIDVDGAEDRIIAGAKTLLPQCSAIIVEASIQDLVPRAARLSDLGFQLFDVVDLCYYGTRLAQVDLVFVRQEILPAEAFTWPSFEPSKWARYLPPDPED